VPVRGRRATPNVGVMPDSEVPLPKFLIIGAQKSGTRWLRVNAGRHPDVYTAPSETMFFHSPERFGAGGLEWYRAQFPGWAGEPIVGEATPGYMMWRHRPRQVAKRIADVVPDVRLIAILRNPIDRADSAMSHFIKRGRLPRDSSLLELVSRTPPEHDRWCLVSGGWYAASLKPYRELFGDRLLVLLHDDITDDPRRVYERVMHHIGAAPDFVPSDLATVLFSTQQAGETDSQEPMNGSRKLSQDERQRLYAYFRDDMRMLEDMIDRDLSSWDPGGSYSVSLGVDPWKERSRRHSSGVDVGRCYEEAATWVEGLVRGVSAEQYELPTPCAKWNVRDLLDNLVELPYQCEATLRGSPRPQPRTRDITPESAAAEYRAASDRLLNVMNEPGRLEGTVASPFGEMSAAAGANLAFIDQLTHGWDLAAATGQNPTIPASLLEAADRLARGELSRLPRRPELFDVEVPVSEAATPTERFVAFLGRDPGVEPVNSSSAV
jgi:uncharacterized protein (TIGR03086 family)